MNNNPIKYSDLVQPDNSIQQLIQQLDELIAKYDAAKQSIQGAAKDAAQNMKQLSGATEEQRQQIAGLAAESEKLAAQYARTNNAEREAYKQKQQIAQAQKEQQRIDKLIVEINRSKEGSYNRLSAQYRLNKIRLNEMSAAERSGTEAGRALETETRKIYEEMSRLQKATGKYTLEVGHYENALKALPGPLGQVVGGFSQMRVQLGTISQSSLPIASKALQGFSTVLFGTVGMVMMFVRYLTGSYKTMREFEQANANLATILGTTRDGMKNLTDSALALGRTTEYTASQVTQLQTELAKLGFTEGSIIAMQKSVLQFATAVGANLGEAAEVAGSTLRAFNLTSMDTDDVLATLAVATNRSALSFDKIKTSIGTVFPVANAFGLTVKDTTALLGALANAGFDASSAATATRNILLNLADANGKLAKAMGGPARTFGEMIDGMIKLRDSGLNLADALELTDKRSVAAFSAFLSGAESAKELRAALEDVSGELDRIQKERLETVEGSTNMLKSAWEGLTLSFRDSQGAIKDTIDVLTQLVTRVNELFFPTRAATQAWSSIYTEQFQAIAKNSKQPLIEIEDRVQSLREQVRQANEAFANTGFFGTLFGKKDKNLRIAEDLEAQLQGAMRAQESVSQMVKENEEERARNAAAAADAEAKKQEELTEKEKKELARRAEAAKRQRIADLRAVVEAINLEIAATEAGTEKMLELRLDKIEASRRLELEANLQKVASERQDEAAINAKYDKERLDAVKRFNEDVAKLAIGRLQAEQQAIQLQIAITEQGTEEMLAIRLENIEKARQIEVEQNRLKAEGERQDEAAINAKYDRMKLKEAADFNTKLAQRELKAMQDLAAAEFDQLDRNERQKTLFRLQQEQERLEAILELNKTAAEKLTDTEVKAIQASIDAIKKERKRLPYNNLYELLGVNVSKEQQNALNTAIDSIKENISGIVDAWAKAAEAAEAAAQKQVDAAQKTLDAEIEARNAGYANNVETARKELELARKTQAEATREKEKAVRAQARIDTLSQTSSLITASAEIWKSLSGIKVIGPALAVAALATMWGSFAAAKVKAAQVTKTEQYGDGTVELLQGGSHASGNDIDLGRKRDGTRRRAEGGEYFAIINKRNSRRFGKVIPDVIRAFNDGTFADKYQRASADMAGFAVSMGTDVSRLEKDVAAIRAQGDREQLVDGSGNMIVRYKNLTRKIYKS